MTKYRLPDTRIVVGPVMRADGRRACDHRATGYVTNTLIAEHGSYTAALAALNAGPRGNVVALRRKGSPK